MKSSPNLSPNKYIFFFYDKHHKPIIGINWNKKILEIHTNRILKAVLPDQMNDLKEPWFELIPNKDSTKKLNRFPEPVGMTALNGKEFTPDPDLPIQLEWSEKSVASFFTIVIYDTKKEIFRGDYSVEDLFRAPAEAIVKILHEKGVAFDKDDQPFYYAVTLDGEDKKQRTIEVSFVTPSFPMEAYNAEGVFQLPELEQDRERITFTKVAVEKIKALPKRLRKTLLVKGERGKQKRGRVIVHQKVYDSMVSGLELSNSIEMGGYLLGHVYRSPDSPDDETAEDFKWIIEVTDVIKAKGTYGNPARLLFTHDSWSNIKKQIDTDFKGKKLVSWFHTHVFEATDDFGLSGLDQNLHRQFFSKSWQVALLLNINKAGARELRCFQRDDHNIKLVESTFEVYSD